MELKVIPQKQEEEVYFLEQEHNSNKTALAFLKKAFQRYFIDAMGAMALGLFSSLIIGLILSQLSKFSFLGFLQPYADMVGASSPVVGAAIGVAIAHGLKAKPLVLFSCAVSGAYGYAAGGPVGAYIGAVVGAEIGGLAAGKTKVDIIVSPITTIVSGCAAAQLVGPGIQASSGWFLRPPSARRRCASCWISTGWRPVRQQWVVAARWWDLPLPVFGKTAGAA